MGISDGLTTAVETAVADAGVPPWRAEQLPLLPADALDGLPTDTGGRTTALRAPGRRGRPAGARNRSTQEWRDYLLSRYRSPLEALAEAYSRPVHDLAAELGCTRLEAFGLQVKAAAELAPYLHGKMPVELQVQGGGVMLHLMAPEEAIRAFEAQQSGLGEGLGVAPLGALVALENQEVSDGAVPELDAPELDGSTK